MFLHEDSKFYLMINLEDNALNFSRNLVMARFHMKRIFLFHGLSYHYDTLYQT